MITFIYLTNQLIDQAADTLENLYYMHENGASHNMSETQATLLLEMLANTEFREKAQARHKMKFASGD